MGGGVLTDCVITMRCTIVFPLISNTYCVLMNDTSAYIRNTVHNYIGIIDPPVVIWSVKNIFLLFLVAYRMYNYSVFAATSVGEGPSADGSFLTREDSEFT